MNITNRKASVIIKNILRLHYLILFITIILGLNSPLIAAAQTGPSQRFDLIPEGILPAALDHEIKRGSGTFTPPMGVPLAYAFVVVPNERAAVVIVNGRTENLMKYQEVAADLVRQQYSVYVYDHRGQGFSGRLLKSEPEKGHVGHFDDYVTDLQEFVTMVVNKPEQHKNLFLLAHSMGGGIATRHLERFPGVFAAAALSSPMHQPNATILISPNSSCWWFRLTGWIASEAWPGGKANPYSHGPYVAEKNEFTHSAERWTRVLQVENQYPNVRLGGPTRGWAAEACAASSRMLSETAKIITPILVLQAGADTSVMPEAQNQFCASLNNSECPCYGRKPQVIEGARHELLIESDEYRNPAMSMILDFFNSYPSCKSNSAPINPISK